MNTTWQNGGDAWYEILVRYGEDAADRVDAFARAGDSRGLQQFLSDLKRGNVTAQWGSESTLGNFWKQLTTDPLAAPLESANAQISKAVGNVFKNPFVLVSLLVLGFGLLGGFDWLGRKLRPA